jgi:4-aminobutyrate aminotransferase-like enzyme
LASELQALSDRHESIGEVRGLGAMLAIELVVDRESRQPNPALAQAIVKTALDKGLLLLACGLDGNVLRLLPPVTISDEDLEAGLTILDAAMTEAAA